MIFYPLSSSHLILYDYSDKVQSESGYPVAVPPGCSASILQMLLLLNQGVPNEHHGHS